ncbi:MAG: right-handed parallel beta-helix repeat-containing protein [Clostridia bacterium]|nr:right-handed parallel beta-helix repeat-containing protein [Clostridia bacterium]
MKKLLWMAALLWLLPLFAQGETLRASPDGLTITEALARCADSDVITLSAGIYDEQRETFPLVIDKAVTLRAEDGAVIDAPPFQAALRIEADGVTLQNLDIRFRRTGVYAVGSDLTLESCRIALADEKWRTSSCGMWCGGVYRMTLRDCAFTGCGVSLAGPPLSETTGNVPKLTGLFEVGEETEFFTTHTVENCTVNGKPLFYAVSQPSVTVPEDAGEIICCGCDEVTVKNADVSDCSMGMVLAYNRFVSLENCQADRCGVFGIYVAKCDGGLLKNCSAVQTNHGLDLRASENFILEGCTATDCDQGLFFSAMRNSAMIDCTVTGTGQGYFMAVGSGNMLRSCAAIRCENGFNLQKEGHVQMTGCTAQSCTVCGVRLDATPTAFVHNTLRDNWVAVMAYGGVSFDMTDNQFENSACCALYLRDIGYSRFTGNTFTGSRQDSVLAVGTLGGSLWIGNALDQPVNDTQAKDAFALER